MRATMRRHTPASSLGSAEEYTPGLVMEWEMNEVPSTTTSSHKRDVAGEARPAAEDAALAEHAAAGDRHVQAAIAECAPMRQLCAIMMRLSSLTPSSMTVSLERAAVDGGVRADLDVVADRHAADLRHLDPGAFLGREAEAVAADDGARLHDAARAETHVMADEHARDQPRVVADDRAALDHGAGPDEAARADARALADAGVRGDFGRGIDLRARAPRRPWGECPGSSGGSGCSSVATRA